MKLMNGKIFLTSVLYFKQVKACIVRPVCSECDKKRGIIIKKIFFILLLCCNVQLSVFAKKIRIDISDHVFSQAILLHQTDALGKSHNAIKVIEEDVEVCCEDLHSKIDNEVVPELISIESKLDQWIGPLTETICSKMDVFEVTVDESCCQTVSSKVDNILIPDTYTIESKLDALAIPECTFIGNIITDGVNPPIVMDGLYTLTANTQGCVTISTNNVIIDLCGFTLSCDSADAVIEISAGCENIKIINGKIEGASGLTNDGILANAGCAMLLFSELVFRSCNNAIHCQGTLGNSVAACSVLNCSLEESNKGMYLEHTKQSIFENCVALGCVQVGFDQAFCEYNVFDRCRALSTANDAADKRAIGFSSSGGTGNLYTECVAEGTQKTVDSDSCQGAVGFLLTGTAGNLENETKIINCIANSTSILPVETSANAYGIKLESALLGDDLLAIIAGGDHGATIYSVNWSPNGNYLAIGGASGTDGYEIRVYSFDGNSLSELSGCNISYGSSASAVVNSVNWSPDGNYLALGGNFYGTDSYEIWVYSFNGSSLTELSGSKKSHGDSGAVVYSVNWSPNGNYLAIGGNNYGTGGFEVRVFSFDGSSLTLLSGCNKSHGSNSGSLVESVKWSPDGNYLAIGGNALSPDIYEIRVYSFNENALTLTEIPDCNQNYSLVYSVDWSPDGNYLVVVAEGGGIRVYSFDGSSLVTKSSLDYGPDARSVSWSPDSDYLIVGGSGGLIKLYSFCGTTLSLVDDSRDYGTYIYSVDFSPDGTYLGLGGSGPTSSYEAEARGVMNVVSNCLIDSNRICNTTGNGFGIVGNSFNNAFIRNLAYENDTNYSVDITNVYTGGLSGSPGVFDNISLP